MHGEWEWQSEACESWDPLDAPFIASGIYYSLSEFPSDSKMKEVQVEEIIDSVIISETREASKGRIMPVHFHRSFVTHLNSLLTWEVHLTLRDESQSMSLSISRSMSYGKKINGEMVSVNKTWIAWQRLVSLVYHFVLLVYHTPALLPSLTSGSTRYGEGYGGRYGKSEKRAKLWSEGWATRTRILITWDEQSMVMEIVLALNSLT